MSKYYQYPCGCSFPVRGELKGYDQPLLHFGYNDINMDCPKVWSLFEAGTLAGVFQLESGHGIRYAKELKPVTIEHLSALTAILRPGTTKSYDENGKNLAQKYCDRKNGKEEIIIEPKALIPVLESTYGVMCIHEDTYVSLKSGYHKPIKDIKQNDIISTLNTETLQTTNNICDGCGFSKISDGFKITLKNGYSVVLTDDHEMLTWEGFKKVSDLSIENDIIACPIGLDIDDIVDGPDLGLWFGSNINIAYLLGQIVGDGSALDRTLIASGTEEKSDILMEWLYNSFPNIKVNKFFNTRCWYLHISHDERIHQIGYGGKKTKFRVMMENYGLNRDCFHKRVPVEIFHSNDDVKWSFIAGWFDSDGHASDNFRTITSSNYDLIQDLRQLLLTLNILTLEQKNRIHIIDIKKFDEKIHKYLLTNNNKLTGPKQTGTRYGRVPSAALKDIFLKLNIPQRDFTKQTGISRSFLRLKFNSYETANKMGLHTGNVRYFNIKSIEKVFNQKFYKMSVRNTHNLFGNGIVIKNCYQEQQILIAKELCGFNLSEADTLRKSVGKKDAKLLFSLQERFLDGARRVGKISESEAIMIFDWIKAAARYSFNHSHSVLYGIRAYKEAYLKLHFPLQFYTSKLKSPRSSKTKDDEVNLIYEMKKWNIPIKLPDLRHLRAEYYNDGNSIYFGLCNIKGFGESNYDKLKTFLEDSPDQDQILSVFFEFVIHCARYLTPSIVENLILSGSVDFFNLSRSHMLEEYKLVAELTSPQKEILWRWVDANNSGVFV